MATPTDRRVIFSSYVVPKETYTTAGTGAETTEEGFSVGRANYTKDRIDSNGNKRLGGKGIASISEVQWNDGWTSMFHPAKGKVTWDSLDDDTNDTGNRWEDEYSTWSGVYLAIAPESLANSSDPLLFLYIKNVDDTNTALVRVQADGEDWEDVDINWDDMSPGFTEDFKIKISPGASICLRGDGSTFKCDEVIVASNSGNGRKIEYLIAK